MPLKRGRGRPRKTKDVKQIKETKRKKEKKEDTRDKNYDKDTRDIWSKKEIMKPTRKSAREIEDTKNIRFGTVEQKQARERTDKEYRLARQRARALRKGDTPPSSLPLPAQLVASTPHPQDKKCGRYRTCIECNKAKALTQFLSDEWSNEYRSFCLHCLTDDINRADETVWCFAGSHETLCSNFIFNNKTYSRCNDCTHRHIEPGRNSPIIDLDSLDALAVSSENWSMISNFYNSLDSLERTVCNVCNEIGFDMQLKEVEGELMCKRCRREKSIRPEEVALYGAKNDMDPHLIPPHLPSLTNAEELLIARAHVLMQYRRVRGCQFKYSGHVVNFMQKTAKIINRLPSLPSELQVLILKPSSTNAKKSGAHQEFEHNFQVRRLHIEVWLRYLIDNYPDYKGFQIDLDRLSQLPINNFVLPELTTVEIPEDAEDDEFGGFIFSMLNVEQCLSQLLIP